MTKSYPINLTFPILLLLLSGLLPLQAAQMRPGERLEYTFSYQGIFSAFAMMDIAHAVFDIQPESHTVQGREAYLTRLDLTTEPYGKAELIYPIRYHYRSWLEPDRQIPLLVSETLQTDKISQELLWFDRQSRQGYRFVGTDESPDVIALPLDAILETVGVKEGAEPRLIRAHRQVLPDEAVWDYLSMLYRLRFADLREGATFEMPLFNGKRIKRYRVKVSREQLKLAGWDRPAFKLSLREVRKKAPNRESVTAVWMSDDEQRLPLRFYVQRRFGTVQGLLETGRPHAAQQAGLPAATENSLDLVF
ncbi:MAG: DUF3108 domain-containing protein [Gammaproteobacteria bacterium]|nr:DUF3108 domain-containing protein [Gammaproteobacteria bacterium]